MLASILERSTPIFYPPTEYPQRVLRCETGRELKVERELTMRGVSAFVPTYLHTRRFGRHKPETVTRPLFPGYVIAAFGEAEFSITLNTPYVYDRLRFGPRDAVIEESEMQRLRAMSDLAGLEPWQGIVTGDRVVVTAGPLSGAYGYLNSHKGATEVVIDVQFLGRVKPITVEGWQIEKA